jgi:hypothetical protein
LMNWGWISDFDYKPPAPAAVVIPTPQNQHVRLTQNVVQILEADQEKLPLFPIKKSVPP